jgi:hypothetical protein
MKASMQKPGTLLRRRTVVKRWQWISIGVAGFVVIVTTTAVLLIYKPWTPTSIIDRTIVEQASFPVYTPTTIPSGFVLDATRTQLSNGALTYSFIQKATNKEIVVTVQPVPANFDMKKLIGNGTVTTTATNNGTLYDLSSGGKSQFLLNTGDALIFFTSDGSIDTATVNTLASDLKRQS